jgi:hypothetical protein
MPKEFRDRFKEAPVVDENSLWYLARDIDDPVGQEETPSDAGAPVRAF